MTTQRDETAIIEEMIRAAETAPEPGERPGTVIPGATPMVVDSITSAGYVRMWDTKTGREAYTNRNMIETQAKKRDKDGNPKWTFRDPGIRPLSGTLPCMLNEAHPRRPEFDALGLPTCPKVTLFDEYQVTRHMRHKHRAEMAMIEERDEEAQRKTDRELQRATLQAVLGSPAGEPAPVQAPDDTIALQAVNSTITLDRFAQARAAKAVKRQEKEQTQ